MARGNSLSADEGFIENNSPTVYGRVIAEEEDPLDAWKELRALAQQFQRH